MAFARRSLATTFTRRVHPSFSYLLLPHHDRDRTPPPSPIHPTHALPSAFAHGSFRNYSSPSGASSFTDALAEKGVDVAELVSEKSLEVATPQVGEVAAAAADSAFPVAALQHLIDGVHCFTGLNWWAAIAATTVFIRLATVPLMINQLKLTTKLTLLRPELEKLKEQMNNSVDPEVMLENQKKMKELFTRHGVTPFSPLRGALIQGPIFISFYLAITNMVEKVPSFKEGGAYWFTDLTTADHLYAFPVLTALSFLVTVELNMQEGMEGNPMAVTLKKFFRVLGFFMIPLTAGFPKGIFCYWITSNIFSLAYGAVLKHPPVRRLLNLPEGERQPTPAMQSNVPVVEDSEQVKQPPPSTQSQSSEPMSSSSTISQRIRELEREVKERDQLGK